MLPDSFMFNKKHDMVTYMRTARTAFWHTGMENTLDGIRHPRHFNVYSPRLFQCFHFTRNNLAGF